MRLLTDQKHFSKISISTRDTYYFLPPKLKDKIESVWREKCEQSSSPLWDGDVYRLADIFFKKQTNSVLIILEKLKYKVHLATSNIKEELLLLPFKKRPNGIFTSAYIQTSDNYLIFSVKAPGSVLNDNINLIGGNLSPDEIKINKIDDIYEAFMLEIKEEFGFARDKVKSISGLGIYETDNLRIGVFLSVKLNITHEEFTKNVIPNFEHQKFLILRTEDVTNMIFSKSKGLNPYIEGTFNYFLSIGLP